MTRLPDIWTRPGRWAFRYNRVSVLAFLLICFSGQAMIGQPDTTRLSWQEYAAIILRHHPVVRQAALQERIAAVERLAGRAGFDPEVAAGWDDKYLDGTHYYRHAEAKLRIPTWLGMEVTGGYENNRGIYLNPESLTDENGLWKVGLQANLLRGLLTDERRTARRQADMMAGLALNERTRLVNDVLLKAFQAYVDWQAAETALEVVRENMQRAEEYFEATRISWQQGDKPAIDTLEAYLIVQDQQIAALAIRQQQVTARQSAEAYLWLEDQPAVLQPDVAPAPPDEDVPGLFRGATMEANIESHPDLVEKRLELDMLVLDQRLYREYLKPALRVSYYPLLTTDNNALMPLFAWSNYAWGVGLSMPLTFRQARADIERIRVKQTATGFELSDKRNTLANQLQALRQEIELLAGQLDLEQERIENYRLLLEAEQERFRIGESSVFLLNRRQQSYLDARINRIRLNARYQKTVLDYYHLSNQILPFTEDLIAED